MRRAGHDKSTRRSALTVVVALVAMTAVGSTIAGAVVVSPGSLGGFENDGDMSAGAGRLDWDAVDAQAVIDDTDDSGFRGSSKEELPGQWVCNVGGGDPPKGDLLRAYVSPRITSTSSAFLDLSWVRTSGTGDAHVNFEFNQLPSPAPVPNGSCAITRTSGDFMLTYDFAGGDAAANIRAWTWTGSAWSEIALGPTAAAAASNPQPLGDDPLMPGTQPIGVRSFGEVSVDLTASGLPARLVRCPGYGFVNVRTRSSGESITSALQDRLPTTRVDLSSCASITVKKVDDLGHGVPGAVFGLYRDDGDGIYDVDDALVHTEAAKVDPAGAAGPATATFSSLEPSPPAYFVREVQSVAGHAPDPTVEKVTPGFREDVVVSRAFVNPLRVGSVEVVKRDSLGNLLNGVRFVALENGQPARNRQGGGAECVTGARGAPSGRCVIGDLVPGSYVVHEDVSTVPSTMLAAPDQTVVVVADEQVTVPFVNPLKPISIGLVKSVNGGPSYTGHVGDPLAYRVEVTNRGALPLGITSLVDAANGSPVDLPPACDDRVGTTLAPGGSFACDYAAEVTPVDVSNTVAVTAHDSFGRRVDASDVATVDVIHPDIRLTKQVNGSDTYTGHAGDPLAYTLSLENTGDVPVVVTALVDAANGAPVALPSTCLAMVGAVVVPGGSTACAYSAAAGDADVDNVATVRAIDPLHGAVSDTDSARVDVVHPAIALSKLVNGHPSVLAHEGDALTYSVLVENTGDIALTVAGLGDVANGAAVDLPQSCDDRVGSTLVPGGWFVCSYAGSAGPDDVVNTASVVGDDAIPGGIVSATATARADVIHPSISITKTVNGASADTVHAGDPLSYVVEVANRGDVPIVVSSLTDVAGGSAVALPTGCANRVGSSLAPRESFSCTYGGTAPVDDVTNVARVVGTDPLQLAVEDQASTIVDVVRPSIAIEKRVNGLDLATVHVDDPLTYTLAILNAGDVPLTVTSLSDDAGGDIVTLPATCTALVGSSLRPGQSVGCSYGASATDDLVNVAAVTGEDGLPGGLVEAADDAAVDVVHPGILIEKLVNGKPAVKVHAGEALTYDLEVTNTGDVALTIASLTDVANGRPVSLPAGCEARIGGSLAPGSSFTCSYVAMAGADDVVNVATVRGSDGLPGGGVVAHDSASADVVRPGVRVVKRGPAMAHEGDVVVYSFAVENTGDVVLRDVAVTDDKIGDIGIVEKLPAGATVTLSKAFTVPAGDDDISNVAEVCGTDPLEKEACDTDTHTLDPIHPSIEIDKTADPTSFSGLSATVTYSYVVTNTGDVALTAIVVDDDKLGRIGTIDELRPGQSATLTRTTVLTTSSPTVNIGTATATDPLGSVVTDDDDAVVDVVLGAVFERELPRTGAEILTPIALGAFLLAAGRMLLVIGDRRRRTG